MYRFVALVVLGGTVALALVGCDNSSSSSDKRPTSTTTTTLPPRVPTPAELQAGLVTLADLPAGWSEQARSPESSVATDKGGICDRANLYARALRFGAVTLADPTFVADPQFGPFVSVTVISFPTARDAGRFMAQTRRDARSCDSFDVPVTGTPSGKEHITVATAPIDGLGDATVAVRLTSDGGGARAYAQDNVYVRRDNVVIALVAQGSTVPEGTEPDTALIERLVDRQIELLEPLLIEVPPLAPSTTTSTTTTTTVPLPA